MEDQFLLTYNEVTTPSWLDNECAVDLVMFDFKIAFDVVNHEILIVKLRHIQ